MQRGLLHASATKTWFTLTFFVLLPVAVNQGFISMNGNSKAFRSEASMGNDMAWMLRIYFLSLHA